MHIYAYITYLRYVESKSYIYIYIYIYACSHTCILMDMYAYITYLRYVMGGYKYSFSSGNADSHSKSAKRAFVSDALF